jgi:hypothetical protein
MPIFALASELDLLSPTDRARTTHIIADDGEWSEDQIHLYISLWLGTCPDHNPLIDDWTRP